MALEGACLKKRGPPIGVLGGGWSNEREVSCQSAAACQQALSRLGYRWVGLDPLPSFEAFAAQVKASGCRHFFNALHGAGGEDGLVPSFLDYLGHRYTHSGVVASMLAFHKWRAKALFRAAGLQTPAGHLLEASHLDALGRGLLIAEPPYVIKPVCGGSSLHVHLVLDAQHIRPLVLPREETWMLEPYIPGEEFTVSVLQARGEKARALGVTRLTPHEGFYSYANKYQAGRTQHECPAKLEASVAQKMRNIAVRAHELLGCQAVSRADFRFDASAAGRGLVLLEVNTHPGMTDLSLVPEQARATGMAFEELVLFLLEQSL